MHIYIQLLKALVCYNWDVMSSFGNLDDAPMESCSVRLGLSGIQVFWGYHYCNPCIPLNYLASISWSHWKKDIVLRWSLNYLKKFLLCCKVKSCNFQSSPVFWPQNLSFVLGPMKAYTSCDQASLRLCDSFAVENEQKIMPKNKTRIP